VGRRATQATLALLVAAGACRSVGERPAARPGALASPIVLASPPGRGAPPPGGAIRDALERLERANAIGDEGRARAELASARALEPDAETSRFLDRVEAILDGKAIARALARLARVEASQQEATFGDPLRLRVVLPGVDVGGRSGELLIPRQVGGGIFSSPRATRLIVRVRSVDLDAYGAEAARAGSVEMGLERDAVARPGSPFVHEFAVEGEPARGAAARLLTVEAELLPAEARFDGHPVFLTRIALAPASVLVLPSGYQALAEDPLASLASALARADVAADRLLLPAALLVPADDRGRAIRSLATALPAASGPRARAVIAALRQLTGDRERGLDASAWLGWATRLR
jgi:hypothetical protein